MVPKDGIKEMFYVFATSISSFFITLKQFLLKVL